LLFLLLLLLFKSQSLLLFNFLFDFFVLPSVTDYQLQIFLIEGANYFQHPHIIDNILIVVYRFNFYIENSQEGFDNFFGDVLVFEWCKANEDSFAFLF
jgi:hypothetical protein